MLSLSIEKLLESHAVEDRVFRRCGIYVFEVMGFSQKSPIQVYVSSYSYITVLFNFTGFSLNFN